VKGPLLKKKDLEWLGVEFVDPLRGKHSGTVEGIEYFKCEKKGKCGSLILKTKADLGKNILEAIVHRYFRPQEANQILKNKDDLFLALKKAIDDSYQREISGINVEYDEEGFIYTFKDRTKKIEFLGFDKIWKQLTSLDKVLN